MQCPICECPMKIGGFYECGCDHEWLRVEWICGEDCDCKVSRTFPIYSKDQYFEGGRFYTVGQ